MIHEELSGSQQMRVGTRDFELSALAKGYDLDPTLTGVYAMLLGGSLYDWEYLIRHVLDVDQRCHDASHRHRFDNLTLLQFVVALAKPELVEFFLQAGANVNAPAAECGGNTALRIAAGNYNGEMVELLLAAGAYVVEEPIYSLALNTLEHAILGGHVGAIKLIICAGANVNNVSYRRLLLHCLTYYCRNAVREFLRRTVAGLGGLEVGHILRVNMFQFLRTESKSMHIKDSEDGDDENCKISEDSVENYDSGNHEISSGNGEYGENTRIDETVLVL
jgi:ankyrin repeat protein